MTIAELVTAIENSECVLIESRGNDIWASERLPEIKKQQLIARKPEVLKFLRFRQYRQFTAEARELSAWLDDTSLDHASREARLPEYRALLEKIAALQVYADQARNPAVEP